MQAKHGRYAQLLRQHARHKDHRRGKTAIQLVPGYPLGATHGWYHVFREICGDVAKVVVFLFLFFGSARWRTPATWWIGFILMLGYYAPFWIGEPFLPALSAPIPIAGWTHVAMASFAFFGLAFARLSFLAPPKDRS